MKISKTYKCTYQLKDTPTKLAMVSHQGDYKLYRSEFHHFGVQSLSPD